MSTTTPNFGWVVPTSTDLVKDGAAAIETLGDSIDASLVDLKGGTTGQVLSKNTNADMDFTWVTPDDADAIQNTIVDAKGDLITATAADTPARIGVGTNGQVLTADSTTATGIKWATPSGGSINEQIFTASGTFTVPTGVTKVWVHMRGGGGGGASTYAAGNMGGSGSGGFMVDKQVTVTSGGSVTVTIGAGGAGGASTGHNDGATGGTTSFGAESASGGAGGKNRVTNGNYSNNSVNGGGNGGAQGANGTGNSASANSGAGGSGATATEFAGGAGGSGIVIVRWIA